jgi:hypothetical protein
MTIEPTLSERLLDMHVRRVDRWSHVDQGLVGEVIWELRRFEAIADAWNNMTTEQQVAIGEICGGYEDDAALDVLLDALTKENNE